MNSKPLRLAVVGVGYLGKFHAQKMRSLELGEFQGRVELVALCDASLDRANEVAQSLPVGRSSTICVSSPAELVGKVDAVTVASVTSTHGEIASLLLSAGIHCNVEKPITAESQEAEELIRIAREKGLVLSVGHSERFQPAYEFVKSKMNAPLAYEFIRHTSFQGRGGDVSVLHDLAIHDLDLLLNLGRHDFELVSARGGALFRPGVLDWAQFELLGKDKVSAYFSINRVSSVASRQFRVYGRDSAWLADLARGEVIESRSIPGPAGEPTLHHQAHSVGTRDNLLAETRSFIESILSKSAPHISGEQGLRALEWVERVHARIQTL